MSERRLAHVVEVSRSADWPMPPSGWYIHGIYSTLEKAKAALAKARAERQGMPTAIIGWTIKGYVVDAE